VLRESQTSVDIGKTVCEAKRRCRKCGAREGHNHECDKRYSSHCLKNRELEHKCYMSSLSDRAPRSDKVLFVFYDFETIRNTRCTNTSCEHVPNFLWSSSFAPCAKTTPIWIGLPKVR